MLSSNRMSSRRLFGSALVLGALSLVSVSGSAQTPAEIQQARTLCPHNSATSLQVTAPVVAGVIWALKNPQRGVVEPEELDHGQVLDFIRPYLGEVVGAYSDWTPLADRSKLFEEDLDQDDPWQFKNFRVA